MSQPAMIRDAVMAVSRAPAQLPSPYPIHPDELRYVKEKPAGSPQRRSTTARKVPAGQLLAGGFAGADPDQQPGDEGGLRQGAGRLDHQDHRAAHRRDEGQEGRRGQADYQHSTRRDNQFIAIRCGAIPDTLLESELFGHEKARSPAPSAASSASSRSPGGHHLPGRDLHHQPVDADQAAADPPGPDLPARWAGEDVIEVDVRILAATNEDLGKMCDDGGSGTSTTASTSFPSSCRRSPAP